MILASVCVSVNLLLGQTMLTEISVAWVVFLRFIIPLALMIWACIVSGFPAFPAKESWIPMIVRCVCFFLTQYFIFWYLLHGSFVIAAVLTCTAPIFVPIADWIVYRHSMSWKMWVSVIISFSGILLILHPGTDNWNNWIFLGLLSGMFSALGQISFNKVAKKERPQDTAFYLFLFGSVLSLIVMLTLFHSDQWASFIKAGQKSAMIMAWLAFGVLTILVQLLRSRAYSYVNKTASVMPLSYFSIIFSAFLAWILHGEVLSIISWIGIFLVILGGVILLHR